MGFESPYLYCFAQISSVSACLKLKLGSRSGNGYKALKERCERARMKRHKRVSNMEFAMSAMLVLACFAGFPSLASAAEALKPVAPVSQSKKSVSPLPAKTHLKNTRLANTQLKNGTPQSSTFAPAARTQPSGETKVPFTSAPFPNAPSADGSSFIWNGQGFVPMSTYHGGYGNYSGYGGNPLSAREKRGRVIWNGATSGDDAKSQAILDSQLRYGAEDPKTVELMWKTAKIFFDEQKYDLAEPLLRELVVTLESHPVLAHPTVLNDARTKLSALETERQRIASSQRSHPNSYRSPYRGLHSAGVTNPSSMPPGYRQIISIPVRHSNNNPPQRTFSNSGIWNDPNGATVTFGP